MSKNSTALRRAGTLGTMAVIGATAVGLVSQGAANADTFVRLPGGSISGDDGIVLSRSNEFAQISPSLAANGAGRTAWVSADIKLVAPNLKDKKAGPNRGAQNESTSTSGTLGTNSTETNGAAATLSTGYIVGCQVAVGNLSLGGGLSVNNIGAALPTATLNGSFSLPLTPGAVSFVIVNSKNIEKKGTYYISYDRAQLQVQGCGGYAQARSFSVVETTGSDQQKVTLYGKPFSIG
ncbi:MAG: MspA family porin [Gordonia paraffinivorans]